MEPVLLGLAFCGEHIKMASVVLRSSLRTKEEVERALRKLTKAHVPQRKSIGFMFACIGRGQHFYNQTNVEADVFRKLFPKTPLLGFFGNGEVGYDYMPDYSQPNGDRDYTVVGHYPDTDAGHIWDLPEMHHSYSTIFVIMSMDRSS